MPSNQLAEEVVVHGWTLYRSRKHKCRCDVCKRAAADVKRASRANASAQKEADAENALAAIRATARAAREAENKPYWDAYDDDRASRLRDIDLMCEKMAQEWRDIEMEGAQRAEKQRA